jgi:nicotinamidase-related amidase
MKSTLLLAVCAALALPAAASDAEVALLIIDIQDFYFSGGKVPLANPEEAAANAGKVLASFREAGLPVVHVRHDFEPGGSIHQSVVPIDGEAVFTKTEVSCFNGTKVLAHLRDLGAKKLVIVGMQTHMCLEAATRAAHDLGFEVTVVGDACATRDLTFDGRTVPAADVHASTLATLNRTYAKVVDTKGFLDSATAE